MINHPMTSFAEGFKTRFLSCTWKTQNNFIFEKTRPGFFSKTVTTQYAPSTQEVEVEAEKHISILLIRKMNNILLQK